MLSDEEKMNCYFIGKAFYSNKIDKNNFGFYENFESFSDFLKVNKIENSTILIKGSRGMALERTLDFL